MFRWLYSLSAAILMGPVCHSMLLDSLLGVVVLFCFLLSGEPSPSFQVDTPRLILTYECLSLAGLVSSQLLNLNYPIFPRATFSLWAFTFLHSTYLFFLLTLVGCVTGWLAPVSSLSPFLAPHSSFYCEPRFLLLFIFSAWQPHLFLSFPSLLAA